jgi:molybdopterin/thiamine biosynthesis adenylyltransferase
VARAFKADVRLLLRGERAGLQRGLEVAWLPAAIGTRLWESGPDSLGESVARELQSLGLAAECADSGETDRDRNRVFLDALCGDSASLAVNALEQAWMVICGCGGLGSNLAVSLAALGAKHFVLHDGDNIEESNLNRLLWASRSTTGQSKVEALSAHLEQRFQAQTRTIGQFVGGDSFELVAELLPPDTPAIWFLTLDDHVASRDAIASFTRGYRQAGGPAPPLIHAGYVGRYCVAGPMMSGDEDPCPFCGVERAEFAEGTFTAPSAAPNNLLIASFVAAQTALSLARLDTPLRSARWCFDLARGSAELFSITKDPMCSSCANIA